MDEAGAKGKLFHAFIYDEINDQWKLAPAYDITYSLNPLVNFTKTSRALSINGKRVNIQRKDIDIIADKYTIARAGSIINSIQGLAPSWTLHSKKFGLPGKVINTVQKSFWME